METSIEATPPPVVEDAVLADAAQLAAIYNQAIASGVSTMDVGTFTPEKFIAKLLERQPREAVLVARDHDGAVDGYGIVKAYSDRHGYRFACETSVYVSRAAWGRGVGSHLQTAVLQRAQTLGYKHVVAKILATNLRSLRFHERFGFTRVGQQESIGQLADGPQDIVILQRLLDPAEAAPTSGVRPGSATLARLVSRLEQDPPSSATEIADFVRQLGLTASDLSQYVSFDHPVSDSYGRRLVAAGEGYELLVMCWRPSDYSAIHDHGDARSGAVMHFGNSEHFTYVMRDGLLVTDQRQRLRPGTVTAVTSDLIHQMGNPGPAPFCSLHVYTGVSSDRSVTADARIFDIEEGVIQRSDGGVFFCLPEEAINRREPGPSADAETTYRQHRHLLERLELMERARVLTPNLHARLERLRSALGE